LIHPRVALFAHFGLCRSEFTPMATESHFFGSFCTDGFGDFDVVVPPSFVLLQFSFFILNSHPIQTVFVFMKLNPRLVAKVCPVFADRIKGIIVLKHVPCVHQSPRILVSILRHQVIHVPVRNVEVEGIGVPEH
jgi:hypothetical protein